ncbi:MAG TPA: sugar transferase [Puia sp.]|nr:sugar transferase [Puia sp.]
MKRLFDLCVSVVVVAAILSWLLPVLALLVWLDSGGPVLFIQERVGKAGRSFRCFKLRSMVVNAVADRQPMTAGDSRITKLGGWLRHTHLDELPQFFNVLIGSMSLVGPRPYMLSDRRAFGQLVPDEAKRYCVRPGITGVAQAKGLHGGLCDPETIRERYYWDNWYVDHAGFLLDLRVLGRTFLRLLPRLHRKAQRHASAVAAPDPIPVLPLKERNAPVRG